MWNSDKSVREASRKCLRTIISNRPVRVLKKDAVKKFDNKIKNLKNNAKTVNKLQKNIIKRKILKLKVIKGGSKFVRSYVNKCNDKISKMKADIEKSPAKKAVLTKKINTLRKKMMVCRRFKNSKAI